MKLHKILKTHSIDLRLYIPRHGHHRKTLCKSSHCLRVNVFQDAANSDEEKSKEHWWELQCDSIFYKPGTTFNMCTIIQIGRVLSYDTLNTKHSTQY